MIFGLAREAGRTNLRLMTDAPAPAAPNASQIDYWNDAAGRTWVELTNLLDQQIEGLGRSAMAALAPKAGERILDVGCGCGQTSLALAGAVGPKGAVTGLDISRVMLDEAGRRAREAGLANLELREADAQTASLAAGAYDGLFSRFGVMFFADPTAAFRNLAAALKPGGRLAFVCWRTLMENHWMLVPMMAALKRLPPPAPPEPGAPGPFAFADPERIRGILAGAGFADIAIAPLDTDVGGNALDDSLKLALRVGPLGALLRENPQAAPLVIDDIRAALAERVRDGAVWMPGAVWIVTATKA
jgi:SAM-dependent methyltransferase